MPATHNNSFFQRTQAAKKVMVLDIGMLGDTVHLLPALWQVRQAYPQAELHVAVGEHVTSVMECAPWVQQTWGYPRVPRRATLRQSLQFLGRLRREGFDVLINFNGSDRSSWLTFFSGAPERLGRVPERGMVPLWRQRFTETVEYPFLPDPIYVQKCRCLERAGFPARPPEFHTTIDPNHLHAANIGGADSGTYFHLSPFTSDDRKELPPDQLVELIQRLEQQFPDRRLVMSCAPTDRERGKLEALLKRLPRAPWRTFAGGLNLMQLAAIIRHSALDLSGDTGTLHVAMMCNAPTVTWYRDSPSMKAWLPDGERHRVVIGNKIDDNAKFMYALTTDDLLRAAQLAMNAPSAGH